MRKEEKLINKRIYDLEERLLNYANKIIKLVEGLPNTRSGNHIGNQLLKSGTAPYAHHGEAQAAESNNDFFQKYPNSKIQHYKKSE